MAEQTELERIQLETAKLNLDEARDSNAERVARKAQRERVLLERQRGFAAAQKGQQELQERCTHRQGGPVNAPHEGTGKAALGVSRMPDGWTRMIKCPLCRGQWFTPHPYLMRKDPFPAGFHMPGGVVLAREETQREAKMRVKLYEAAVVKFNELLKLAKDKLTPEAAQEMDCGTTHTLTNQETGVVVYPWRQCDVAAYQELARAA